MLRNLSNGELIKGSKWMEWLDLPSRKIPLVGAWRDRFKGAETRLRAGKVIRMLTAAVETRDALGQELGFW